MTDEKRKLTFRETMGLLGYGFKLVGKLAPGHFPRVVLQAFLTAAQPMLVLFFSARILNELSGGRDAAVVALYAGATVVLTFLISVSKALLTRAIESTAGREQALYRIHMMQAQRFGGMDFAHAEDSSVSEILARMDIQAMGNGLGLMNMFFLPQVLAENLFSLAFSLALLTGGLSAGGVVSGWQAAALCGLLVLGLLITVQYLAKQQTVLQSIYEQNATANTSAQYYYQYLNADQAAKDIRIFDQAEALSRIFQKSFATRSWLSFFFFEGRLEGFGAAMLATIAGGFYLSAGFNALKGTVLVGGIVQSVGAATALATSIGMLLTVCGRLYNNGAFLQPMRTFLTLPDVLVKGNRPVPPPTDHAYRFEFRNVSFRYPGAETYALRNLNLKLNAGQRLAVVGLNGSGKTTMIKLLCRLYDPTEGEILLDGVNAKEYDYQQYITLFSVVFQDFALFPLGLAQNVAAGEAPDPERVRDSLDGAGFSPRLATLPEGLDTVLYKDFDEDGTQISGGEAQKIALARALYKDAPLVVLDEPTAALDPVAEHEVYTTFDKTIGEKTAVFISHRLSSCRFCDDIAVFDGGRLVQRGGHEALLADKDGRYYELWHAQARHYVKEEERQ